jgi:hypothetical protein
VQIVDRVQNLRQQFVRSVKMAQVGPRITPADAAIAGGIERAVVLRVPCLLDRHFAFGRKQQSMAGGARRQHAIHHVDARLRILRNLFGSADPHQITRLAGGKMLKRG